MSGAAFIMSGVTAFLVGWLAYRGSGHWWTGLAAGGTTWGLVVVVPIALLAMSLAMFGIPYQGTVDPMVTPAVVAGNVLTWGWLAYRRSIAS